jgi:hypothetical protein
MILVAAAAMAAILVGCSGGGAATNAAPAGTTKNATTDAMKNKQGSNSNVKSQGMSPNSLKPTSAASNADSRVGSAGK